MPYVTDSANIQFDCDQMHELLAGHCHLTTACSIYAQLDASVATYDMAANGHPLPIADDIGLGYTPRPDLQPPKHSSKA